MVIAGCAIGSVVSDASVPLQDADIESQELVLGYARSLDMWGMSGKFDVILPYAWSSGSAEFAGDSGPAGLEDCDRFVG